MWKYNVLCISKSKPKPLIKKIKNSTSKEKFKIKRYINVVTI